MDASAAASDFAEGSALAVPEPDLDAKPRPQPSRLRFLAVLEVVGDSQGMSPNLSSLGVAPGVASGVHGSDAACSGPGVA